VPSPPELRKTYDEALSNFAFNFNLQRYSWAAVVPALPVVPAVPVVPEVARAGCWRVFAASGAEATHGGRGVTYWGGGAACTAFDWYRGGNLGAAESRGCAASAALDLDRGVKGGESRGAGGVVSLDMESGCVELNECSVAAAAAASDGAAATTAAAPKATAADAPDAIAAAAISAAAASDTAAAAAINAAAAAAARSTRSRSAAEQACHGISRAMGSGDVQMCRRSGPEQDLDGDGESCGSTDEEKHGWAVQIDPTLTPG
jgi:hypothetical protein